MEDLIVVGIAGPSGSGKDASASALAALRGCQVIGLADAIKSALDDLDGRSCDLTKRLEAAGISKRRAWQLLGSESRIQVRNRRLWTCTALAKIHFLSTLPAPVRRFVVPDVRYPHEELEFRLALARWGGRFGLLALERPGLEPLPGEAGKHSSEQCFGELTPDLTFVNQGPLKLLREQACWFFDDVAGGFFPARDPLNPMGHGSAPGPELSDLEESA